MRALVIAGLVAASFSATARAELITDGQLTSATIGIITHLAADSFDKGPAPDLSGRHFVIETGINEFASDTFQCQPYWTYGRDDGVLKVTVTDGLASTYTMLGGPGAELTGAPNHAYQFRPFVCSATSISSPGVNGFGAPVQVRHRKITVIGLSKPYRRETLTWSRTVSADEGRALASALRVRTSGTVGTWGAGGSIGCVREHSDATFSAPIEDDTTSCVVKVDDLRTDLIDSRTGEVLATELPSDADGATKKRRH